MDGNREITNGAVSPQSQNHTRHQKEGIRSILAQSSQSRFFEVQHEYLED